MRVPALLALTCSVLLAAEVARAEGALAVGIPSGGLRAGFAYGLSYGYGGQAEAIERALEVCRQEARNNDFPESTCRVERTFTQQCAAIAMDTVNFWAGWAIASDENQASDDALANCGKGGPECRISDLKCDKR